MEELIRTTKQGNSIHLYCRLLADAFNEAGLDMRTVLKPNVAIQWNSDTVKEYIWKPIQNAQFMKDSTRKLNTKEVGMVYETINRHVGERFGIHVPFPSKEPDYTDANLSTGKDLQNY